MANRESIFGIKFLADVKSPMRDLQGLSRHYGIVGAAAVKAEKMVVGFAGAIGKVGGVVESIGATMANRFGLIGTLVQWTGKAIGLFAAGVALAASLISKAFRTMWFIASGVFLVVKALFMFMFNMGKLVLKVVWAIVSGPFKLLWATIKLIWSSLKLVGSALVGLGKVALGVVAEGFSILWSVAKMALLGIAQLAINLVTSPLSTLAGMLVTGLGLFALFGLGKSIFGGMGSLAKGFGGVLGTVWDFVGGAAESAFSGIKKFAKDAFDWIGQKLIDAIGEERWNKIKEFASSAWNGIQDVSGGVVKWIGGKINEFFGGDAWNRILKIGSLVWSGISAVGSTAWNTIASAASSSVHWMSEAVASLWEGVKQGGISAAKGILAGLLSGVMSTVKTIAKFLMSGDGWLVGAVLGGSKGAGIGGGGFGGGGPVGTVVGTAVGGVGGAIAAEKLGEALSRFGEDLTKDVAGLSADAKGAAESASANFDAANDYMKIGVTAVGLSLKSGAETMKLEAEKYANQVSALAKTPLGGGGGAAGDVHGYAGSRFMPGGGFLAPLTGGGGVGGGGSVGGGGGWLGRIGDTLKKQMKTAGEMLKSAMDAVKKKADSTWEAFKNAHPMVAKIVDMLGAAGEKVRGWFTGAWGALSGPLESFWTKLTGAFSFDKLGEKLKAIAPIIDEAAGRMGDMLGKKLMKAPERFGEAFSVLNRELAKKGFGGASAGPLGASGSAAKKKPHSSLADMQAGAGKYRSYLEGSARGDTSKTFYSSYATGKKQSGSITLDPTGKRAGRISIPDMQGAESKSGAAAGLRMSQQDDEDRAFSNMRILPKPYARGGIVTKPTNARIGEAGPEAVIPLGQGGGGMSASFGQGGGRGPTILVQLDGMTLMRAIGEYVTEFQRDQFMRRPSFPMAGIEPG